MFSCSPQAGLGGPADGDHHGDVEEGEEEDGDEEEDCEGDLVDGVPGGDVQHGTEGRLGGGRAVGVGEGHVVDLGEEDVGHAGHHGHGPAEGGDEDGAPQVGEGEDVEGPADGQVALQGEGDDGEDVGVGGRLGEEGAEAAEGVAEDVRVLVPVYRQLVWQSWTKVIITSMSHHNEYLTYNF